MGVDGKRAVFRGEMHSSWDEVLIFEDVHGALGVETFGSYREFLEETALERLGPAVGRFGVHGFTEEFDYDGVYGLRNLSSDRVLVGCSDHVRQEVLRIFSGAQVDVMGVRALRSDDRAGYEFEMQLMRRDPAWYPDDGHGGGLWDMMRRADESVDSYVERYGQVRRRF